MFGKDKYITTNNGQAKRVALNVNRANRGSGLYKETENFKKGIQNEQ